MDEDLSQEEKELLLKVKECYDQVGTIDGVAKALNMQAWRVPKYLRKGHREGLFVYDKFYKKKKLLSKKNKSFAKKQPLKINNKSKEIKFLQDPGCVDYSYSGISIENVLKPVFFEEVNPLYEENLAIEVIYRKAKKDAEAIRRKAIEDAQKIKADAKGDLLGLKEISQYDGKQIVGDLSKGAGDKIFFYVDSYKGHKRANIREHITFSRPDGSIYEGWSRRGVVLEKNDLERIINTLKNFVYAENVLEDKTLDSINKKSDQFLMIRICLYRSKYGVDIRNYVQNPSFVGYTKQGVRIPLTMIGHLIYLIEKLRELI